MKDLRKQMKTEENTKECCTSFYDYSNPNGYFESVLTQKSAR